MKNLLNNVNPLNAELNFICHLLALLGAHHILHVSRVRVNIPQDPTRQKDFDEGRFILLVFGYTKIVAFNILCAVRC